jgi:peptidoglycan/LPS O-acetylase OafA/YrhL
MSVASVPNLGLLSPSTGHRLTSTLIPAAVAGGAAAKAVARAKSTYHPELDSLRFLAFLSVFLHHTLPRENAFYTSLGMPGSVASILSSFISACGFGVDLFFLLSAYLITSLLMRERAAHGKVNIPWFYVRRALRLWPLYLSFVLIALMLPLLSTEQKLGWRYGTGFLLFLGNWMIVTGGFPQSVVFPLWSVSVEQQFYFAWPWAVRSGTRRRVAWVAAAMLGVATLTRLYLVLHHAKHESIWCNTFARLDPIAAGALVAIVLLNGIPNFAGRTRVMLVGGGLLSLLAVGHFSHVLDDPTPLLGTLWGYPASTLGCGLLLLAALRPANTPQGIGRSRSLVYLGKISYGLYMFHAFALWISIHAMEKLPAPWNCRLVFMVMGFALTTALGAASYQWLERPFLRLKSRFAFVTSRPGG